MDDHLQELHVLAGSLAEKMHVFRRAIERNPSFSRAGARASVLAVLDVLEREVISVFAENADVADSASRLRSLQGMVGAICASLDWQSPSFLHALQSEAGLQTGRIQGTINDYKRDHHLDSADYEKRFIREYVDRKTPLPVRAHLTVSGMSALATIVNSLQMYGVLPGPILLGCSSYFENKMIIHRLFPGQVVEVDEEDTEGLIEAVRLHKPKVIFLDSLCNAQTLAMPDLARLMPALAKLVTEDTYLVLDNSGLGPSCQPLRFMPAVPTRFRLVVFESLNKHHQFGLDRVTGGVIWTQEIYFGWLSGACIHLGTQMPDVSVLSLPTPNRALLDARLALIGRNAQALAEALDTHVRSRPRSPFARVAYPGLPAHPSYAWARERSFHGASLIPIFKDDRQAVRLSKIFLSRAIKEARSAHIDLTAGTSFGLDTTRVYLTALHASKVTTPFLRISAGTESPQQLAVLIEVFKRAMDAL
ncbi:MAG: PLP-dependent transferase [Patescibacteria group bacterium]|jgi:cystathionine beta-lyase/cystathionine gamma-synthase